MADKIKMASCDIEEVLQPLEETSKILLQRFTFNLIKLMPVTVSYKSNTFFHCTSSSNHNKFLKYLKKINKYDIVGNPRPSEIVKRKIFQKKKRIKI